MRERPCASARPHVALSRRSSRSAASSADLDEHRTLRRHVDRAWWALEGPAARRRHGASHRGSSRSWRRCLADRGARHRLAVALAAFTAVRALARASLTCTASLSVLALPARRSDLRPGGGPMRTLITNGTVVTADGSYRADVLVDGETIAQIGRGPRRSGGAAADETIDATRQVRHPGRRSTSTPTWSCRSAARSPRTPSRPGRARRPSAGRPRSSTSPSSRAASRCARASTRGTPRPRATRSPTTAST